MYIDVYTGVVFSVATLLVIISAMIVGTIVIRYEFRKHRNHKK